MANIVEGRLYLPPTDPTDLSTRDVIHPETNVENVLINVGSDNATTKKLSDVLDNVVHVTTTSNCTAYSNVENCVVIEKVSTI
jgi:hypothetical protein